jgi:hypothetical protein
MAVARNKRRRALEAEVADCAREKKRLKDSIKAAVIAVEAKAAAAKDALRYVKLGERMEELVSEMEPGDTYLFDVRPWISKPTAEELYDFFCAPEPAELGVSAQYLKDHVDTIEVATVHYSVRTEEIQSMRRGSGIKGGWVTGGDGLADAEDDWCTLHDEHGKLAAPLYHSRTTGRYVRWLGDEPYNSYAPVDADDVEPDGEITNHSEPHLTGVASVPCLLLRNNRRGAAAAAAAAAAILDPQSKP